MGNFIILMHKLTVLDIHCVDLPRPSLTSLIGIASPVQLWGQATRRPNPTLVRTHTRNTFTKLHCQNLPHHTGACAPDSTLE